MFNVSITKDVEEYLGCRIYMEKKGEITVNQPHIYNHLEEKSQDIINMLWTKKKNMTTPSTPTFKLIRVKEGKSVLSPKEQKMYQCGVAVLLYLVKQTRPDLANTTRKLLKAMDQANYLH